MSARFFEVTHNDEFEKVWTEGDIMNGFTAALLAETIILLIMVVIVIHDRWVQKHDTKKEEEREASSALDLYLVKKTLNKLPETATFEQDSHSYSERLVSAGS